MLDVEKNPSNMSEKGLHLKSTSSLTKGPVTQWRPEQKLGGAT